MIKREKKCKGTGKAIGNGCGKLTVWRKYGLCFDCYKDWLLNTPEGGEVVKKHTLNASRKVKNELTKEKTEWKNKNKSIAKLKQEARKVFQQWIRMRDANELCICCGKESNAWDAGHYYKAELYSGVIFHEMNVNKQAVYCNQYLHGNEGEYRKGLIKKYGIEKVEELDKLALETKGYKWTREELENIKIIYKNKIKNYGK